MSTSPASGDFIAVSILKYIKMKGNHVLEAIYEIVDAG